MDLRLTNKVVVLTGATGGIGGAICRDLLLEGAIVNCIVRNMNRANDLRAKLTEEGVSTMGLYFYETDILDYEQLQATCNKIISDHPTLDVLVNCAGKTEEYPFALQSKKQIDSVIDLNLKTPMYLTQLFLKPMFAQKQGSIINISSLTATMKGRGVVPYAGSKGGLESFTRALSNEVGRKGVRVNCVRPGLIVTDMSEGIRSRAEEIIKSSNSMNRFGTAEEISKAVLFLASHEMSSYITGECITVDGGIY